MTGFDLQTTPPTMSSLEIAELVEKRHDNVKRTIETLAERGVIEFPQFEEISTATKPMRVYHLQKRDTLVVVAQLSPEFTARVVDRWQELEQEVRSAPLPDLSDPAVLMPLLQSYAQRTQVAEATLEAQLDEIRELAPKADAYDVLDGSEGSMNVRLAAKALGVPERKFTKWLTANGWAFRQNGVGPLQGYSEKRNAGYLEHRSHTYYDQARDESRTSIQMLVTAKGLARLAKVFSDAGVPA